DEALVGVGGLLGGGRSRQKERDGQQQPRRGADCSHGQSPWGRSFSRTAVLFYPALRSLASGEREIGRAFPPLDRAGRTAITTFLHRRERTADARRVERDHATWRTQ